MAGTARNFRLSRFSDFRLGAQDGLEDFWKVHYWLLWLVGGLDCAK